MNELPLFQRALIVIADIATLAIASGLIFAVLVQPRREKITTLFALFCVSVAAWGLFSLSALVPELQFGLAYEIIVRLMATSVGFSALAFLLFVLRFAPPKQQELLLLNTVAPILVAVGTVLVWLGLAYEPAAEGNLPPLTGIGYVLVILIAVHAALAFWIIAQSPDEKVRPLRIPALLLVLSYVSTIFSTLNMASVDTVLATITAVWSGWVMLRLQLVKPVQALTDELRTANLDLRQSVNDLSEARTVNAQLQDELMRASSFKSEFFTGMSHKMRTPLNSIVGYSELLQSGIYGELSEKQADRLEKIHRNGNTLLELINNMLDLGKMEAGRLELQPSVFRANAVFEPKIVEFRTASEAKGLTLEGEFQSELQPLFGDEKRVQQILAELLENAIKFTNTGSIKVSAQNAKVQGGISADFKLPFKGWLRDGEWVVLSVADTGIGIPPEHQAQIFDEFYQVDEGLSSEIGGTGLGLNICKRLVEMHEGVIWVKSAPEQGSTFFVALPAYGGARETLTAARVVTAPLRGTGPLRPSNLPPIKR